MICNKRPGNPIENRLSVKKKNPLTEEHCWLLRIVQVLS